MTDLLLCFIHFIRLLLHGHQAIALVNAALRVRLAAFHRKRQRPPLTTFDRLFWVGLSRVWRGCLGGFLHRADDQFADSVRVRGAGASAPPGVMGERSEVTRRWASDRGRDSVAATDMNQSLMSWSLPPDRVAVLVSLSVANY